MKTTKLNKKSVILQKPNGPETYWKVTSPKLGGGSTRRFFKDESDADTHLEQQEVQIRNWGVAGASLNEKLRGDALAADEILKPFNASLRDAAAFYANHLKNIQGGVTIENAIEFFKKTRASKEYSPLYQKALAHHLKHFGEAFPNKTSRDITPSEIEAFLSSCGAVETIKTYRKTIKAMFNFLVEEGHSDKNPVRKSKIDEVAYSVEILTPEQCAKLLASCDDETLPSVAIGMFCGLRSSEIERLNWSKVNLLEKVIVLDAAVARKTGSRRVVPIHETCVQWLTPYAKTEGSVQPSDFRNKFDLVRVRAGFKPSFAERKDAALQELLTEAKKNKVKLLEWPSNCLRHSAISYAMADCGDHSKVASWAGNSPAMIKKHYDAQATPSQAKAFYSILPTIPENQLTFNPKTTAKIAITPSPVTKTKRKKAA